jgi:hypothetical protein
MVDIRHKEYKQRERAKWQQFFRSVYGPKPSCQVCSTVLDFDLSSVYFDHRLNGQEYIKIKPTRWAANHPCTEENRQIWLSCQFGILCHQCNIHLPTLNRRAWVENVMRYVSETESVCK